MVKVKICGIKKDDDARAASRLGADMIGLNFWSGSPRSVSIIMARRIIRNLMPPAKPVGIFVDEASSKIAKIMGYCGIDTVQLHGNESPEFCKRLKQAVPGTCIIKAFRLRTPEDTVQIQHYFKPEKVIDLILLDSHSDGSPGGTGKPFDWTLVFSAKKYGPIIIAGGLHPENIREVVLKIRPFAVDAASGIEKGGMEKGVKDHEKMKLFITRAKSA